MRRWRASHQLVALQHSLQAWRDLVVASPQVVGELGNNGGLDLIF